MRRPSAPAWWLVTEPCAAGSHSGMRAHRQTHARGHGGGVRGRARALTGSLPAAPGLMSASIDAIVPSYTHNSLPFVPSFAWKYSLPLTTVRYACEMRRPSAPAWWLVTEPRTADGSHGGMRTHVAKRDRVCGHGGGVRGGGMCTHRRTASGARVDVLNLRCSRAVVRPQLCAVCAAVCVEVQLAVEDCQICLRDEAAERTRVVARH